MPSKTLVTLREELAKKQENLKKALDEAGPELDFSKVTLLEGKNTVEKAESFRAKNAELDDIAKKIEAEVATEAAVKATHEREKLMEKAGGVMPQTDGPDNRYKSLGERFITHEAVKALKGKAGRTGEIEIDVPVKTTMTTSAGFAPESLRTGEVVPYVRRPLRMLDIIPAGRTTQAAIKYMEQTTRTNAAGELAENGAGTAMESALAWTERSVTVENLLVWIPVTMQQLEDVVQMEGIINEELMSMLRERIDSQTLNGNGSTPNLQGIIAKTGVQTMALAGDRFDALFNMLKNIRVTGRSSPDNFVFHPNDWSKIRLARTDDGLYILGNPNELVERVWGLPAVETDAEPEHTVLAGAFSPWCKLYERRGVLLEITDSHSSDFIYCKYEIRATIRVAMVITRPAAFHLCTGF